MDPEGRATTSTERRSASPGPNKCSAKRLDKLVQAFLRKEGNLFQRVEFKGGLALSSREFRRRQISLNFFLISLEDTVFERRIMPVRLSAQLYDV